MSFHREKFRPKMGPDGGDGGKGGDVWLQFSPEFPDLSHLSGKKVFSAESGKNGGKNKRHGKSAADLMLKVPEITLIYDLSSERPAYEISKDTEPILLARGGRGGKGNAHFSSSVRKAPMYAQQGEKGEEKWVRLEWIFPADVGILGKRGAGKTSLLRQITGIKIPSAPTQEPFPFRWKPEKHKLIRVIDFPPVSCDTSAPPAFMRHLHFIRVLIIVEEVDCNLAWEKFIQQWKERKEKWEIFLKSSLPHYSEVFSIWVVNKIDLRKEEEQEEKVAGLFCVSAKNGEGISEVRTHLLRKFIQPWEI